MENLHLSGNPLNKELMQKHLLGTAAVLQHLRDRQSILSYFKFTLFI